MGDITRNELTYNCGVGDLAMSSSLCLVATFQSTSDVSDVFDDDYIKGTLAFRLNLFIYY